jgi:preprotein translocase subunit SecY
MAIKLPFPLADAEFCRRLLVTLAALFVFRAGYVVPLPIQGQDLSYGPNAWKQAIPVFSLGLGPFFTVLVLVEFAKIGFPPLSRWEAATPRNAARLYHYMFFAALVLAGLQSFALVHNLERMHTAYAIPCIGCAKYPLTTPDPEYTFAAVLSLIAGTALIGWLIRLITLNGLGNGFWVIYAALGAEGLPQSLYRCLEQWRVGYLDIATLGIAIGFFFVAIAALVAVNIPWDEASAKTVNRRRATGFQVNDALAATILSPILAGYAGPILMSFLTPSLIDLVSVKWQIAATLVLGALLILPFTALYRARGVAWLESGSQDETKAVWTTALAQTAVSLGAVVMGLVVPLPFFINPSSIIIFVAVAVDILKSAPAERND